MVQLRALNAADLDLICHHREQMFREAGRSAAQLTAMAPRFREWLAPRLAAGAYFGFIAQEAGRAVGGVGLMAIEWPPHPLHPTEDQRGYVLNLYVEPDARRQGIARTLMEAAEAEFARRGLTYLVLHATETGRRLYDPLGWAATSEMAKSLPARPA